MNNSTLNLVIDIGNTRLKYGVFNKTTLIEEGHSFNFNLDELLRKLPIENSIICSVAEQSKDLELKLKSTTNYIEFTSSTPLPLKNQYQSKQTLGGDRLAAAVGAHVQFPNANVLTIDMGTCIKYNFTNANNEYLGGGISPGIDMRLKALNTFTQRLPQVEADYNFDALIGSNTQESILSGVMNGASKEVEGILEEYAKQYPNIKIVITGGNHAYFAKRLKSSIFADPFLLLKGLNAIIEFNISKKNE